jgi:hypothetical protein
VPKAVGGVVGPAEVSRSNKVNGLRVKRPQNGSLSAKGISAECQNADNQGTADDAPATCGPSSAQPFDDSTLGVFATALLILLADPKTGSLSDRELGRRCGLHGQVVAGFRLALHAIGGGPGYQPKVHAAPAATARRSWSTPSRPGHTLAFEAPALNALDCWALASEPERQKFVSSAGLRHLYAAAPPDERTAFLRHHQIQHRGATPVPIEPVPPIIGNDPGDIPPVLRRVPEVFVLDDVAEGAAASLVRKNKSVDQ